MHEAVLLEHIYRTAGELPEAVAIPPGDDMGGIRIGKQLVLVTVDPLVEKVHFHTGTPLENIARKAMTRNLSDVAAMAAKPCGAVVAALLPRAMPDAEASRLFDEMRSVAASFGCPLVGGDISAHDGPMVLTVTVFAKPAGVEPVLRSTARVGDAICVTGELGGSLLENDRGSAHHLDFTPRLAAARRLCENPATRPHAMIDLSDGLGADLPRICKASNVSAEVELDALPVRAVAQTHAAQRGVEPWRSALGDGEDYELLFTLDADHVPADLDGLPVTRIGTVVKPGPTPVSWRLHGKPVELPDPLGWEHRE
ncbi:MAG: thiamine-phosphate kinase [Phycisphaeraceae bacterium]